MERKLFGVKRHRRELSPQRYDAQYSSRGSTRFGQTGATNFPVE